MSHAFQYFVVSNWDSTKLYDKDNPECIHYDFRWKVSQREKIRGRQICSDTDPDLDRWPGDKYACEETNIDISIERSRQRGLKKRYKGLDIDWNMLDSHMEGLGTLFSKKRRITFGIEFVFKEVTGDSGNHHKLLPRHLEEIFHHIKGNMKEGEKEEEVEIDIEIPPTILKDVLDDRDIEGDRMERLEAYCAWNLQHVKSDQWTQALQAANQFALDQFLELNSILQHPKVAADLMVKGGVKPGIALQFVSSIRRLQQETEKP
ncbi:hypothetical protein F5883DRAFT_610325 [Diaporthe sp. PMI_573]|nr:hypothetical protein F5883DRAFT_610325 [Diaporthaceae sp. PMI_573]